MGRELDLLPLRKKIRLKIFENSLLRRMSEAKTEEIRGGWRKLHNLRIFVLRFLLGRSNHEI
jgi:hypothetical protein